MEDAVAESFRFSSEGDCVLLSPACASWDMYESFEEREVEFLRSALSCLRRKIDGQQKKAPDFVIICTVLYY